MHRLAARNWTFAERVVAPGTRVTAVGTYQARPRRIDVGLLPQHPDHAVHPGAAATLAAGQWRTSLVFAGVLMALAVAAHLFVYLGNGVYLRGLP